jgi:hypothetical protein
VVKSYCCSQEPDFDALIGQYFCHVNTLHYLEGYKTRGVIFSQ